MNVSESTTSPKLDCANMLADWLMDWSESDSAELAELMQRVSHVQWTRNWAEYPPQTEEQRETMWDDLARALRILLDEVMLDRVIEQPTPGQKFATLLARSEYNPR